MQTILSVPNTLLQNISLSLSPYEWQFTVQACMKTIVLKKNFMSVQ